VTRREACQYGQKKLKAAGIEEAALDAWYLLEYATGCTRSQYLLKPEEILSKEQEGKYQVVLGRRAKRIPLQHITGVQEFMGLTFQVNEQVLIPRQDTEILVEEVLRYLKPGMCFLDLCTGSGCILLSLLHHCPGTKGLGADISNAALQVAGKNQERLGLKAKLIQSDLFDGIEGSFDVIVSNPPYIKREEIGHLMEEVRLHDPILALDGHEDGLYFYRRIIKESPAFLKKGGRILFEIGYDQGEQVSGLLEEQGFCEIEIIKDLAGLNRVVRGIYPG